MNIPEGIFKSYDIRGIYPEQLNEENSVPIARAIYKFFKEKFPQKEQISIVLGRDMRISSPAIFEAVKKTLMEYGAEVLVPGIVSTPTFYFAVFDGGYDCGIQITASHNPKNYNGLKFVVNSEKGLIKIGKSTGMDEIKRIAIEEAKVLSSQAPQDDKNGTPQDDGGGEGKETLLENLGEKEVDNALKVTGNPEVKPYKVVADAANALGALYLEELFKKIPGELVGMNFELDGTFPVHQADPLQYDTLIDLQARVKSEQADLGLAPDGDGDRLFFIDERGEIIQPSYITSIVAREVLKENPGSKILVDIRYLMTPKKIVEENGGELIVTKVGHAFITEKLYETGGVFAGESSAHFFFKATGNAEGPLLVLLYVLKAMSESGKKISELVTDVKRGEESGETNFKVKNAKEIMEKVKAKFSEGELSEIDGVAITFPDWRLSMRTSNTEPLLRLNVEAETAEKMKEGKEKVMELINEVAEFEEGGTSH